MKKKLERFKKFYKENRIFVILMGIVLVCMIISIALLFKYFYFGTGKNLSRTCAEISEGKMNEFILNIEKDETVSDASLRISDKSDIIFITIEFKEKTALVEAQTKAVSSLDSFEEEARQCYDFQFMISKSASTDDESFALMGSLNANGTNVSWNNNTKVETKEE